MSTRGEEQTNSTSEETDLYVSLREWTISELREAETFKEIQDQLSSLLVGFADWAEENNVSLVDALKGFSERLSVLEKQVSRNTKTIKWLKKQLGA